MCKKNFYKGFNPILFSLVVFFLTLNLTEVFSISNRELWGSDCESRGRSGTFKAHNKISAKHIIKLTN